jgi:Mrp family chromosome partitioning ATPase
VVLDAPPLLAASQTNGPGGLTVASRAATTVMVVLAGRTKADKVRQAQEKLVRAGGHLSGVVLNDRENPSLRAEMERELGRLARWAPGLVEKARNRLRTSRVLGMRV